MTDVRFRVSAAWMSEDEKLGFVLSGFKASSVFPGAGVAKRHQAHHRAAEGWCSVKGRLEVLFMDADQ